MPSRPKRGPGRPPKPAKEKVGQMLALRLSDDDKFLLDELVRVRAARLAVEGGEVTASSIVRGLIRQAADAEGIRPAAADEPRRKPKG